ncbi:DUF4097 domain-containing protein [Thermodesulfobacteriota bacterium]
MRNKYRISIIAFLFLLALSLLIPGSMVIAGSWKTIDDDSWCDEGWFKNGKEVCEVRELDIEEVWDLINVDASPNGGISVEGWENKSIRLTARVQAKAASREEAREILSDIDIKTEHQTIKARGPKFFNSKKSWTVSYRLMVPQNIDLELNALNGGISIDNVHGQIDAKTLNGGIKLEGISGDVDAHTTNGGITARLNGDRWKGKGLDLHTTNGGIKLSIPENYSAQLEAGTVNGGMKIDFPIKVQGWIKKNIKTTLGEGGAAIKARTINGGVNITNG